MDFTTRDRDQETLDDSFRKIHNVFNEPETRSKDRRLGRGPDTINIHERKREDSRVVPLISVNPSMRIVARIDGVSPRRENFAREEVGSTTVARPSPVHSRVTPRGTYRISYGFCVFP